MPRPSKPRPPFLGSTIQLSYYPQVKRMIDCVSVVGLYLLYIEFFQDKLLLVIVLQLSFPISIYFLLHKAINNKLFCQNNICNIMPLRAGKCWNKKGI